MYFTFYESRSVLLSGFLATVAVRQLIFFPKVLAPTPSTQLLASE